MNTDSLARAAALRCERNAIDAELARLMQRPMTSGHLGEWIAAQIFDIELQPSVAAAGIVMPLPPLISMCGRLRVQARPIGVVCSKMPFACSRQRSAAKHRRLQESAPGKAVSESVLRQALYRRAASVWHAPESPIVRVGVVAGHIPFGSFPGW